MFLVIMFLRHLLLLLPDLTHVAPQPEPDLSGGEWQIITQNAGVSAMHMTLTHTNTIIMIDRTDYGASQLRLPQGRCRIDPNDLALKIDCYAHSIELDLNDNSNYTVRPLQVNTDTWCSSAAFSADGTLVSTGGYNDGADGIRYLRPCYDQSCDWADSSYKMVVNRWYASNQILPDNRIIVIGGRRSFSYEFVPLDYQLQMQPSGGAHAFRLPFLFQTNTVDAENNLYPFLHLSSDGNLFIFANRQSILFDYKNNKVVRTFPDIPDGPRNYPSSGSSVMLPLSASNSFMKVEIMICGGAPEGSFPFANNQSLFTDALKSCGRMVITDPNPSWVMEDMPYNRVMGDMLILPNGQILIINGAQKGTAGWHNGREPAQKPVLYIPEGEVGQRFEALRGSNIPRMYHSTANVLPDGRILVGGSNPNVGYELRGVLFPTELRLETFSPSYLHSSFNTRRPAITSVSPSTISYNSTFTVYVEVQDEEAWLSGVEFRAYAPPFTTHAVSMNQRQLLLMSALISPHVYVLDSPPSPTIAPSGYYLLFPLNGGIPGNAWWVYFSSS